MRNGDSAYIEHYTEPSFRLSTLRDARPMTGHPPGIEAAEVAQVSGAPPRRRRADAERNRQRILEAAEATFAREGIGVPIDEVARAAGVGIGTLYRHFPTKESLCEAIILRHIDLLVTTCDEAVEDTARAPVDAFFTFLRHMADELTANRDLFDALGEAGTEFKARCQVEFGQLETCIDTLRQRAVDAGGVRADVTTPQIVGLVSGTCKLAQPGADPPGGCRMLDVVFDGLRR